MLKYFTLLSIFISSFCVAQNPADYVMGNTGIINDHKYTMDVLESQYPGFKQAADNAFNNAQYFNTKSGGVYTVNVVVHVVHSSPEINIPDSVIYDQIAVLNEDYGRTNADSVNLRPMFQSIAGNPHIQFNLKHIERVPTTATFSLGFQGLPDEVKQTAEGGSDAWDTDYHLNIWICKLEDSFLGSLFGYAYPPAGLSNWPAGSNAPSPELDGVVLDYRTVGRNNPNPYPNPQGGGSIYINGRTGTHEVGHYLGLRHIWGDGGGFGGGDSCGDDDGIADTPNQGAQSSFNCDPTLNTCTDPSNDMPDLIENHMDYSDEGCKNMFTIGQASHMRSVLENERADLISVAANISEEKFQFSAYPNPASETLTIESTISNYDIEVYDAYGRLVSTEFSSSTRKDINVQNFESGIYLVKVITDIGTNTKSIVVR